MPRSASSLLTTFVLVAGLAFFMGCSEQTETPPVATAPTPGAPVAPPLAAPQDATATLPDLLTIPTPVVDPSAAAAVVNGVTITEGELQEEMGHIPPGQLQPGMEAMARQQILDRSIKTEVHRQWGAAHNVQVSDASIAARIKEIEDSHTANATPDNPIKTLDDRLATMNMTRDDLKKSLHDDMYTQAVVSAGAKSVTPEAVAAFYEERKATFTVPSEMVKASHILFMTIDPATSQPLSDDVKKEKLAKANEVMELVRKGEDFAQLAKAHTDDKSTLNLARVKTYGDLGFSTRESWTPKFSEAAFGTKVGEVTGPIETEFGYHIIKVTGRRDAGQVPLEDEEVQDFIRNNIFESNLMESASIVRMGAPQAPPPIMISTDEVHTDDGGDHEGHDHESHAGEVQSATH